MSSNTIPTIEPAPAGHPTIEFGKRDTNYDYPFKATYYKGWLFAVCFGGTGFAIQAKDESEAMSLLSPIRDLDEYDVIRHCNNTPGWWILDYYKWKLVEGKMKIEVFELDDKGLNYKETVK
jgi:hypothetical protein